MPEVTYTVDDGHGGETTGELDITVTPVNDAPVAVDDKFTVDEDKSVTLELIGNDTDVENDTLHLVSINGVDITPGIEQDIAVPNGKVNVAIDGTLTFVPNANYNGPVEFDYVVADTSGAKDTGHVTIDVTPVNDAPVITPLPPVNPGTPTEPGKPHGPSEPGAPGEPVQTLVSTPEDQPLVVLPKDGLLSNVTDIDGDKPTIKDFTVDGVPGPIAAGTPVDIPGIGTLVIDPDGGYTFTPKENYNGPVPDVTYTVDDGKGGKTTGELDITVTPVNDAPVAVDDKFVVNEDSSVKLELIGNDTDVENDTLHLVSINGVDITPGIEQDIAVPNGKVNVAIDGTLTFVPNANYNGTVDFDYVVTDTSGAKDTGHVTIDVTPVNDAPVITPLPPVNPGTPTEPGKPHGPSEPGAPGEPVQTLVDTPEDQPLVVLPKDGLLSNVTDIDGDKPTIKDYTVEGLPGPIAAGTPVDIPGVGTLVIDPDGGYTFTPKENYNGPVPDVTYTVDDGKGGKTTGELDITVTPVNDAPVAVDDKFVVNEDSSVKLELIGNDTDVENDTLHLVSINGVGITPGTAQSIDVPNGKVNVAIDGTLTFVPNANYNGPVEFDYVVADTSGATDTGHVTIDVTPVNDAPVITPLPPVEPGNPGQPSTPTEPGQPHGPSEPGAPGEPVQTLVDTPEDQPLVVLPKDGLLSSVTDIDGDKPTIKDFTVDGVPGPIAAGTPVDIPGVGTLVIDPDGGYTFTPKENYNGPVPDVTYTVDDGKGGKTTGELDITVTPVNDAPVAVDDKFVVNEDSSVKLELIGNDTDVENDTLHLVSINGVDITPGIEQDLAVPNGKVNVAIDGTLTFVPNVGYSGETGFDYVVADPSGASDTGRANIEVVRTVVEPPVPNNPPEVIGETVPVTGGNPVHVDPKDGLLKNDTDREGDPLTVKDITVDGMPGPTRPGTPVEIPGKGTLIVDEHGGYMFTPVPGFSGDVKVNYTVSDDHGGLAVGTLTLQVASLEPVAVAPLPVAAPPAAPLPGAPVALPDVPYYAEYPFVYEPSDALFDHDVAAPRITAEGAVLDAVNGIQSLNGTASLDGDGAVLRAVNGVDSLRGSSLESSEWALGTSTGNNVVSRVALDNRLHENFGPVLSTLGEFDAAQGESAEGDLPPVRVSVSCRLGTRHTTATKVVSRAAPARPVGAKVVDKSHQQHKAHKAPLAPKANQDAKPRVHVTRPLAPMHKDSKAHKPAPVRQPLGFGRQLDHASRHRSSANQDLMKALGGC